MSHSLSGTCCSQEGARSMPGVCDCKTQCETGHRSGKSSWDIPQVRKVCVSLRNTAWVGI